MKGQCLKCALKKVFNPSIQLVKNDRQTEIMCLYFCYCLILAGCKKPLWVFAWKTCTSNFNSCRLISLQGSLTFHLDFSSSLKNLIYKMLLYLPTIYTLISVPVSSLWLETGLSRGVPSLTVSLSRSAVVGQKFGFALMRLCTVKLVISFVNKAHVWKTWRGCDSRLVKVGFCLMWCQFESSHFDHTLPLKSVQN